MRAPGAGGGGERKGGGGAGGSSGEIFEGGWGAPLTAPGAARAGSCVSPSRSRVGGAESLQPDPRVGEGRSRSHRKPHGEGAGKGRERGPVCLWGRGAAAKGGEGGTKVLPVTLVCLFPGVGAEARLGGGAFWGSWGYLRGRGGIGVHGRAGGPERAQGLGPIPAAGLLGKQETRCGEVFCWGPARPCDPLYSCHNSGTFGAAPNGTPGRPAPPGNPRPPGARPAHRGPLSERRPPPPVGWFR